MRSFRRICSFLLACAVCSSCATVSTGRYERIPVTSAPEGAAVAVDCGKAPHHANQKTPTTIVVPRNATPCRVLVRKDGYESTSIDLRRRASADLRNFNVAAAGVDVLGSSCCDDEVTAAIGLVTMVGGVVWGGVGLAVDRATGAMFHHVPQQVSVVLHPEVSPKDTNDRP